MSHTAAQAPGWQLSEPSPRQAERWAVRQQAEEGEFEATLPSRDMNIPRDVNGCN